MRIRHYQSGKELFLPEKERVIFIDPKSDSAAILFKKQGIPFPEELLPLLPSARYLKIGVEIGWLGFPSISDNKLCFFAGRISSWDEKIHSYLIDGVAINGVSGGPVCYKSPEEEKIEIMGTVSAYRPNRLIGETLPGLLVAQDVSYFHKTIAHIKSMDEAQKEQKGKLQDQQQNSVKEKQVS